MSAARGLSAATVPFAAEILPPRRPLSGPAVEIVRLRASSDSIFFRIACHGEETVKRLIAFKVLEVAGRGITSSRLFCFRRVSLRNDDDDCGVPDTPDDIDRGRPAPTGDSRPSAGKCTAAPVRCPWLDGRGILDDIASRVGREGGKVFASGAYSRNVQCLLILIYRSCCVTLRTRALNWDSDLINIRQLARRTT